MGINIILSLTAAAVAFAVTALSGKFLIPFLRKVKFGQTILDIGPTWHKAKQGTPTMGGFMFIAGTSVAVLFCVLIYAVAWPSAFVGELPISSYRLWGGLALAFVCGFIGFLDDYLKVVKKINKGLSAPQKFFMQLLAAAAYAVGLYLCGDTTLNIPFVGSYDIGAYYIPLVIFLVAGFNNAVNLTDGIDGLCSSVTFLVALTFMLLSGMPTLMPNTGMSIFSAAVAGGCLGFLIWNFFPAKVFMGDTGSLFLGGAVCALAFGLGQPLLLLPAGIIYIIETASVILQVLYFKITKGKRLFKMSPYHHHLEMKGFSEIKVVFTLTAVTLLGCIFAFLAGYFG